MRLPPLVYLLGAVSFLMDVASEMAYPLLPLFLASLGAGPGTIGLVEGVAEATASLFKVVGGRLSDRLGRRRPFLLLGYGLPALFRPLLALAQSPFHVLLYRFLDRTGKGLRTAPRDALIAESAPKEALGRAYGLHRSLDTLGATLGPFLAFLLLPLLGFRGVFWLSALPALLAFLLLFAVRETPRPPSPLPPLALGHLSPGYRRFLLVSGLFALALSSNAFLLLRLKELGLSQEEVALAYTLYNLLYALLAYPLLARALLPALRGLPPSLLQAARVLGAGPFRAFLRVELPLLLPALSSGTALALAALLGEFGASLVLWRPEWTTLALAIYERLGRPGEGPFREAVALALVLALLSAGLFYLLDRGRGRFG